MIIPKVYIDFNEMFDYYRLCEYRSDKDCNKKANIPCFIVDKCLQYSLEHYASYDYFKRTFMNIDKNDGVYITYKLAEIEGYKLGDKIKWHIAGDDQEYTSTIVGFNKDPQNQNMTMTKEYYESLGKTYKQNTIYTNKKLDKSASIDGVNLIQDKNALKESMNNMLSMMQTMISLIIFIAVMLGVIIIYNLSSLLLHLN